MSDRERFIARMALLFMSEHLEEANEMFRVAEHYDNTLLDVNGDEGSPVSEYDIEQLLFVLQG